MGEALDGEYQSFKAKDGAYVRKEFFGKYPELLKLVEHMTDEEVFALRRGGHDPQKVYNAYKRADGTHRLAHRDPGQNHQRLRTGRSRRGPQRDPSAEKAQ